MNPHSICTIPIGSQAPEESLSQSTEHLCQQKTFQCPSSSLERQILQKTYIKTSNFVDSISSNPQSPQLLKFSSSHHWSSLLQILSEIRQKNNSAQKDSDHSNSQKLDRELSEVETHLQKDLLRTLIKIYQIIGWTWIPKLRLEHIKLNLKQQCYFIEAFSLINSMALNRSVLSKNISDSAQGNSSYTQKKDQFQKSQGKEIQTICFTLRQAQFSSLYGNSISKTLEKISKLLNRYLNENHFTQIGQGLIRNNFQIQFKTSFDYNNNMKKEEQLAKQNPKEVHSSPIRPQNEEIKRDDNNFVIELMKLILDESDDHHIHHDHSEESQQLQNTEKKGINHQSLRYIVLSSIKQVLQQKEFSEIELNPATLKVVTCLAVQGLEKSISQIKNNLKSAINSFNQQICDFLAMIQSSNMIQQSIDGLRQCNGKQKGKNLLKNIFLEILSRQSSPHKISMEQSIYEQLKELSSPQETIVQDEFQSLTDKSPQTTKGYNIDEEELKNIQTKRLRIVQSFKSLLLAVQKEINSIKQNSESQKKLNDHQNLVDDIILLNYVKLCSKVHEMIFNPNIQEKCKVQKNKIGENQIIQFQQEKGNQQQSMTINQNEEQTIRIDAQTEFEDLEHEQLQKPKDIESSLSQLSESSGQNSFSSSESSFAQLNDSISEKSVYEHMEQSQKLEQPETKPEAQSLDYSQMNKAFLLSKTHISFDTIDLSRQQQLRINDISIDQQFLCLNESTQQDHRQFLTYIQTDDNKDKLKAEFVSTINQPGSQIKNLTTQNFKLEEVYKQINPISDSNNINLHIKYVTHLSQYIQECIADMSNGKHKSLEKVYNIVRFIVINLLVHLRQQLVLNIDQSVKEKLNEKQYQWDYLNGRNNSPKWQQCERKIAKIKDISSNKIQTYIDNIPKLQSDPKYAENNPNVAKAQRLSEKCPDLMKLIQDLNTQPPTYFNPNLTQSLFKWTTKLLKEQYLNEHFFHKSLQRICKHLSLRQLQITQIIHPDNLKLLIKTQPKYKQAFHQLMIIIFEQFKIWNVVTTIPFYSLETQRQNFRRKNDKNKVKTPIQIQNLLKNLDYFYIYKYERINTQYLDEKKNSNPEEFYKALDTYLDFSHLLIDFFNVPEQMTSLFKEGYATQPSKFSNQIHLGQLGILNDSQTRSLIFPSIESIYTSTQCTKDKQKFTLHRSLIQSGKKALQAVRKSKTQKKASQSQKI